MSIYIVHSSNAIGTLILCERKCFLGLSEGFAGTARISELQLRDRKSQIFSTTNCLPDLPDWRHTFFCWSVYCFSCVCLLSLSRCRLEA